MAELVGKAEAAGHDEGQDVVGQRRDRHLGSPRFNRVGRPREDDLCLVGHLRRPGRQLEALAAIAVLIEVAMVYRVRLPPFGVDRQAGLQTRSDLHDRRGALHGVQPELAADGQSQWARAAGAVIARGHRIDHRVTEHGMSPASRVDRPPMAGMPTATGARWVNARAGDRRPDACAGATGATSIIGG